MNETNVEKCPPALCISGVKKMYKLGQIGGGTLQADLQSWWARVRGKEDPNTKVDANQRLIGKTFMALNGIDLTIYKGEAVGIIGGNGAGKSTLLKLISQVTAPTAGKIELFGRVASMLEVGTGFNGEMTGRENVYMNGAILGMTKAEIDAKMEQIIEFSEVRDFIDTPVKRYSSGMYVKLAFSVAAHLDSEIMIMDEVLAVGDMAFQKKCLTKMREAAKQEGRTVLYVSHNMNTIRQLCDRCIVLDKGKVIFNGSVEDAIQVYLGYNIDDLPIHYELENVERPSNFHGTKIRMISFDFLAPEKAIFENDKPLCFTLKFKALESLKGIRLYFILLSDAGQRLGMAETTDGFADTEAGKYYEAKFSFDISNLTSGKYFLTPDIFAVDSLGNHLSYDNAGKRMVIQIEDKHSGGLNWQEQWHGRIRLNPVQCFNIKEG